MKILASNCLPLHALESPEKTTVLVIAGVFFAGAVFQGPRETVKGFREIPRSVRGVFNGDGITHSTAYLLAIPTLAAVLWGLIELVFWLFRLIRAAMT